MGGATLCSHDNRWLSILASWQVSVCSYSLLWKAAIGTIHWRISLSGGTRDKAFMISGTFPGRSGRLATMSFGCLGDHFKYKKQEMNFWRYSTFKNRQVYTYVYMYMSSKKFGPRAPISNIFLLHCWGVTMAHPRREGVACLISSAWLRRYTLLRIIIITGVSVFFFW